MTGRPRHALLAFVLLLPACSAIPAAPVSAAAADPLASATEGWKSVATDADRLRVRNWWTNWDKALASARAEGHGAELDADPVLFGPKSALPNPHLPPGTYKCRTTKIGSQPGMLGFITYGWFECRVTAEQNIFSFTKTTGSQRPVGLLFDDSDRRQIFLGTLELGDEVQPMDYGADPKRDMAALVERIGPTRWRMVFPAPAYESLLDVIELVPAT